MYSLPISIIISTVSILNLQNYLQQYFYIYLLSLSILLFLSVKILFIISFLKYFTRVFEAIFTFFFILLESFTLLFLFSISYLSTIIYIMSILSFLSQSHSLTPQPTNLKNPKSVDNLTLTKKKSAIKNQKQAMTSTKHKQAGNFYYCPHDILGTGTWGTVYKSKNIKDDNDNINKQYALKKINKFKIDSSQSSFLKYKNQVIALQKANSIKQIIQFVDFFKSKSNYYIITEYVVGSIDLYHYLQQHPNKFSQIQARLVWVDLLTGIQKLHNLNIIHRDLKLQNILYIPDKQVAKIIDFGLATTFGQGKGRVGSLIFMSPQIINNQPYTEKCDIWSLGIVFFWMVCKCSPYGDNSSVHRITQIMKDLSNCKTLPLPKGIYVSERCQQVIKSCLKWNQKQRLSASNLLNLPFFTTPDLEESRDCLQYYQPQLTFVN